MAFTPAELLERALNGENIEDDTQDVENGTDAQQAVDAAEPEQSESKEPEAVEPKQDDEPVGAPIASKSGAYTIPYEKLAEAREARRAAEAEAEALRAQLAELNARQQANLERAEEKAQDRADAGLAATQADKNLEVAKNALADGVDVSIFGDFSEEALAKGIAALVQQAQEQLRAELQQKSEAVLAPLKEKQAKDAADSHYNAIYAKHPDAQEIVNSAEFDSWYKSLPTFTRNAVAQVLDPKAGGTAAEVIEVFDTFKAQTGRVAAVQGTGKAPEVQRRIPNSLSEAAGEQHQDITQQVMAAASAKPTSLIERMQDMSPEQIERLLNAI